MQNAAHYVISDRSAILTFHFTLKIIRDKNTLFILQKIYIIKFFSSPQKMVRKMLFKYDCTSQFHILDMNKKKSIE